MDTPTTTEQTPSTEQTAKSDFPEWFHRFAASVHRRFNALEETVADIARSPVATAAEDVIGELAPNAKPVVAQLHELRGFLGELVGAFENHFGTAKLNLPTPPTGT